MFAGLDNPTLYRTFTAGGGLEVRQYFENGKTSIYHPLIISEVLLLNRLCYVALQTRHQQTWTSWSSQLCVTVFAGTCRISRCLSSLLQCILRWSTRPKVRRLFCNSADFLHPSMQSNTSCFALLTTTRHQCPVAHSSDINRVFFSTVLFFFFFHLQVLAEFSHHTLFCRAAFFCCQQARNRISVVNKS